MLCNFAQHFFWRMEGKEKRSYGKIFYDSL